MKRLLRNAAICTVCRDEIESKYRVDLHVCSCGLTWVDGGTEAPRSGGHVLDNSLWDIEDDRGWDD